MRMTEEQYAARFRKPAATKPSKHRNVKTLLDGIIFDSKVEAERYAELKFLEKAGDISNLEHKVKFELAPGVVINGRKRPPLRYFADFTYYSSKDGFVVEDVKGSKKVTEGYRIKRHLMKSVFDIDIMEIRK